MRGMAREAVIAAMALEEEHGTPARVLTQTAEAACAVQEEAAQSRAGIGLVEDVDGSAQGQLGEAPDVGQDEGFRVLDRLAGGEEGEEGGWRLDGADAGWLCEEAAAGTTPDPAVTVRASRGEEHRDLPAAGLVEAYRAWKAREERRDAQDVVVQAAQAMGADPDVLEPPMVWVEEAAPTRIEEVYAQAMAAASGGWARCRRVRRSHGGMAQTLERLTGEQWRAVAVGKEESCVVVAGAGTGKTSTLEGRVVALLGLGVRPEKIAVMTFTNRAARELSERVGPLCGAGAATRLPVIGTYHAVGGQLLRRHAYEASLVLGIDPPMTEDFSVLDEDDQATLLRESAHEVATKEMEKEENGKNEFRMTVEESRARIAEMDVWARKGPDPEEMAEAMEHDQVFLTLRTPGKNARSMEVSAAKVLRRYEEGKRRRNALDYRDLVCRTVRLLEAAPELAPGFAAVLGDEYQDTDEVQGRMIDALRMDPKGGPRCPIYAVGDPDQLIYEWRGAEVEQILGLPARARAHEHALSINWRSPQHVLDCANAALEGNERRKKEPLRSVKGAGRSRERVDAHEWSSAQEEARFHGERIARAVEAGTPYGEIAVLGRSGSVLNLTESELMGRGIPYKVTAGRRFGARAEVRDVAAWLRVLVNERDDSATERCLTWGKKGFGDRSVEIVREWTAADGRSMMEALPEIVAQGALRAAAAARAKAVHATWKRLARLLGREYSTQSLVGDIIEESGIGPDTRKEMEDKDPDKALAAKRRNERLQDLQSLAAEHRDAGGLAEHLALADSTQDAPDGKSVVLSTIHQAKGREFEDVAVIGIEAGLFPSMRGAGTGKSYDAKVEEERRCLHVAITRAKRSCVLSWSRFRHGRDTYPSMFIEEIGHTLNVQVHERE